MRFRYNDDLSLKRYVVEVPDGTRFRKREYGTGVRLPGCDEYLPDLVFLSNPRYSKWVKILSVEPLTEEIPNYREGEEFPWNVG